MDFPFYCGIQDILGSFEAWPNKGKKKSLLRKHKQQRFIEAERKEEKLMMTEEARRSLDDKHQKEYYAMAEESDLEEFEDDIDVKMTDDEDTGYAVQEDEPDAADDFDHSEYRPASDLNDDNSDDNDEDPDDNTFVYLSDLTETENDEEAHGSSQAPPKPKRAKKKKKITDPAPDGNPTQPSARLPAGEEDSSWTRHLSAVPTHPFTGNTPRGPTFAILQQPVDYFLKFFPVILFTYIADMTNINLGANNLVFSTTEEIRAYFGIRIVMGLSPLRIEGDYWSDCPGYRNELISKTMTKSRFQQLSRYLACSDPRNDPKKMTSTTYQEKQDKFNYIQSHPLFYFKIIWDTVLQCCRRNFNCFKDLSIDEAMVPYRGFKAWCQKFFMPCKPVRAGFKVYAMCEAASGYMCNFNIHVPSKKPTKYADIAFEVAKTHLDKGHNIYTDKLYTHMNLASSLLARSTYLTGAIKTNSSGLPNDLSFAPQRNKTNLQAVSQIKQTPRGTFYVRQRGPLTYTLWHDSNILSLLSSAHNGYRDAGSDFVARHYADVDGEVAQPQVVPAPPAVIAYCKHMGGVDRHDLLRSYHSINRKSQSWWKQVLFFLVDIARVNAWICYKFHHDATTAVLEDEATPTPPVLGHNHFTMAVAKGLIEGYSHGQKTNRQRRVDPVPLNNFNGLHVIEHMGVTHPKACKQCILDGRKATSGGYKKTVKGCPTCGVHLCPVICFQRFHAHVKIDVGGNGSD